MNKIPSRHAAPLPRLAQDEELRRQAEELAASLDAAEAELERDGPVSPAQLAAILRELEEEWEAEPADTSPKGPMPGR